METVVADKIVNVVTPFEIREKKRLVLEDTKTGIKRPVIRVTGLFQRADFLNANGRVYPQGVLENAVKEIQENIKKRSVLGELDHPTDAKIHLDRVSHLITKAWMEGDKVFGECEVLEDLPCGKMLKALLDNNVCISVSSRGVGDLEMIREDGQDVYRVSPGYKVVTWDAVLEPSVTGTELSVMESKIVNLRKQYELELFEEIKKQFRLL